MSNYSCSMRPLAKPVPLRDVLPLVLEKLIGFLSSCSVRCLIIVESMPLIDCAEVTYGQASRQKVEEV